MKSIKEKAKDHAEFMCDSLRMQSLLYKARMHSFEAGANYVIEQIEDILTHPRRYVNSDTSEEEAMLSDIAKLVEQLKEK